MEEALDELEDTMIKDLGLVNGPREHDRNPCWL